MPSSPDLAPRAASVLHLSRSRALTSLPVAPFVAAGAALAAEMTTHLVDFGAYGLRIRLLDSSYEWCYSHLLATGAFAVGALAAGWGLRRAREHRRAWLAATALFAFLFVDGATRVHEHIPAWPVLYAPILIGLAAVLVVVAQGTDRLGVVYAGLMLLFGSLAIHVFGPAAVRALGWGPDGWAYQVKVALKEGSELAGWVLLVPAVVRIARRRAG